MKEIELSKFMRACWDKGILPEPYARSKDSTFADAYFVDMLIEGHIIVFSSKTDGTGLLYTSTAAHHEALKALGLTFP